MTNKEALEFARQERAAYKRKVKGGFGYYQRVVDYYDIVVEALEKQVPMKPIIAHETDYDVKHYLCPVCDEWVSEGANYCYDCGQAIDWSEEE